MAVKSQIDISVNSSEFLALKAAFDKYEAALKKMPAAWQNVGRASTATKTNFESAAANMKVVGSSLAAITTSSKEFFQVTTATARHWKDLALSTKSAAVHIKDMTESMLKWTGIISLVTGGAGLFGFDRLAHSVASQRMAALGTGGERAGRISFLTNFRRMGDPEGLLSRIADMQSSIQKSVPLRILGLTAEDLKGPPEEVALKALRRGGQIASTTTMPVGSDPRLAAFSTPERIWLRDHRKEIEELIGETKKDKASGRFHLDPAEEKSAQDFTTKMDKAGQAIETIFVKGLVKLAGPLGELSDSVVKLTDKFLEKALPDLVKDLGGAIDWLAKEVEKPSFVAGVEAFVNNIASLATSFGSMLGGLARFARWLGVADPLSGSAAGGAFGTTPGSGGGGGTGKGYGRHGAQSDVTTGPARDRGGSGRAHGGGTGRGGGADSGGTTHLRGSGQSNIAPAMAAMEDQLRREGVPDANVHAAAALMVGQALSESSLNPNAVHDQGTGFGIYGARDPRNARSHHELRRTRMFEWLAAHGYARNSLEGQARYMGHEAMTDYSATRRQLMGATEGNIGSATRVITPNFEAPGVDNSGQRIPHVRAALHVHPVAGGNTSLSSGAAAAGSP